MAKTKSMTFILLVGDQPVHALIAQLKYENQELFDWILPFFGPFHIQCFFMSAINKRSMDLDYLIFLHQKLSEKAQFTTH